MARTAQQVAWFSAGALAALGLAMALWIALRSPTPEGRVIEGQDGIYTVADRSVACRSEGGRIACTNGRVIVECDHERCRPYYLDSGVLPVTPSDAQELEARTFPSGVVVNFGFATCVAERAYLHCHLPDYQGGFQMNGIFARSSDFDDAPNGWPGDGVRYGPQHRVPGI